MMVDQKNGEEVGHDEKRNDYPRLEGRKLARMKITSTKEKKYNGDISAEKTGERGVRM